MPSGPMKETEPASYTQALHRKALPDHGLWQEGYPPSLPLPPPPPSFHPGRSSSPLPEGLKQLGDRAIAGVQLIGAHLIDGLRAGDRSIDLWI